MSLLLLVGLAWSGTDADVTTGVVAFQQGDYARAVEDLEEALEDPSQLKPKNVPKAWFHLGRTYFALERGPEAADAFAKVREVDPSGEWDKSLDAAMAPEIWLNAGLMALAEDRSAEAERLLSHHLALRPATHAALDLRGQARQRQGDTAGAIADFDAYLALVEATPPADPDILGAYVAYRRALLAREANDVTQALELVERGVALATREYGRLDGHALTSAHAEQYAQATADLGALRLDLLLNSPLHRDVALNEFEAAVAERPDDGVLWLAYAQLLEAVDEDKAIAAYDKAAAIESSAFLAHYNLGALYNNRAATAARLANATGSDLEYQVHQTELVLALTTALPHFEKAHELDPTDASVLDALLQATMMLGDMPAYEAYKAKRDALP